MKIKQTILTIALSVGIGGFLVVPVVSAATCGGIQTSIINCTQKGMCADGTSPYEGAKPSNAAEINVYITQYKHGYGQCDDGTAPNKDLNQTGVWGVLLFVINIL